MSDTHIKLVNELILADVSLQTISAEELVSRLEARSQEHPVPGSGSGNNEGLVCLGSSLDK